MGLKIKLPCNYYDNNIHLFKKNSVEFNKGLTSLIGCNGIGKSTLLSIIESTCENGGIPVYKWDYIHDGGHNFKDKMGFNGEFNYLATSLTSSEGENIIININFFMKEIIKFLKEIKNNNDENKKAVILLDGLDSGLSIDNIIIIRDTLLEPLVNICEEINIELYLIITANSFELIKDYETYNVSTGIFKNISNYNTYRNIIIESSKIKEERDERRK